MWFENVRFASTKRTFLTSGRRKNLGQFSFFFLESVQCEATCGQHFCHSTPQGVAQSLQIQRVFTLCSMSPHIGARPFEPHWIHPIYPDMKNLDFWSVRSISEVQQWPKETHSNVYAANDANYLFTHGCSTSHMLRKPTWRRHAPPHPTPTPCNVQTY